MPRLVNVGGNISTYLQRHIQKEDTKMTKLKSSELPKSITSPGTIQRAGIFKESLTQQAQLRKQNAEIAQKLNEPINESAPRFGGTEKSDFDIEQKFENALKEIDKSRKELMNSPLRDEVPRCGRSD